MEFGSDPGQFGEPQGLAMDSARNRVLVADTFREGIAAIDLATNQRSLISHANAGRLEALGAASGAARRRIAARQVPFSARSPRCNAVTSAPI